MATPVLSVPDRESAANHESAYDSWAFDEGAEIYPGRFALRLLGGGRRYEAYLAHDEILLANVVVKILRPDRVAIARPWTDSKRSSPRSMR